MLLSVEERAAFRMISQQKPLPELAAGFNTLREGAGWMPLADTGEHTGHQAGALTGWIAVTGDDRVRWLNGMVTNSVQALQPGGGAYSFLLNAQGRIQGDGTVWAETDRLLIETDAAQVEPMMALLDHFIIMDDVVLEDVTAQMHGLTLAGPGVPELLRAMGLPEQSGSLRRDEVSWRGMKFWLVAAASAIVPRYEIWAASAADLETFAAAIPAQAQELSAESFELLRILEQRPRFGQDIRERDLPQETAQDRALHFQKGCYLGQEIVERIRSRGQVHRTFTGFALHGAVPPAGAELLAEGKPVGLLTTVAAAEIDGERLALGYIRRDALERRATLSYRAGTAAADDLTGTAEARTRHGASKA